ncbi:MAG: hypothetical protein D6790_09125, partial [Caldilineae bacterium]
MALPPRETLPLPPPGLDYAALRRAGLARLPELTAAWTDFNEHDPGVTILEQLCYALTDLAYRSSYPIPELLASGGRDPYRSLPGPARVLPSQPVTLADLRKLALDVEGVRNAWFEPLPSALPGLTYDPWENALFFDPGGAPPHRQPVALRGLLRVRVQAEAGRAADEVADALNARLRANRPLGMDFTYPQVLPAQPLRVDADIEIGPVADPRDLLAQIYCALDEFIAPRVRFRTLPELLAQG